SFDSSGESLHERGYRRRDTGAPLRETLAAAILEFSGWDGTTPFLDPMCGSGTLCMEAAMKGLNIAPGLLRASLSKFGFQTWHDFNPKLWEKVLREAQASVKQKLDVPIIGLDRDRLAI